MTISRRLCEIKRRLCESAGGYVTISRRLCDTSAGGYVKKIEKPVVGRPLLGPAKKKLHVTCDM